MRIFRFLTFCYLVLAIVLTSLSAIVPALAQESTAQVHAGTVWGLVAPYLFTAISAAVVAVLGWLTSLFQRWTGIQIEARHREALHSAAMTGVAAAFNKIGQRADTITLDVRTALVKEGVEWMLKSVPDALKYFDLSPQTLATLVEAKLNLLLQAKAAESAGVVPARF
jgi:ABC-type multidrug transport system fused ATPase/permease subunit